MICSIHQPNYIPYIGLFHKINESDTFIFYDTAQYTKGDFHNRNKIKTSNGEILLTIPVNIKFGNKINEVKFNSKILKKHFKSIGQAYKKSIYFDEVINLIKGIYSYDGDNLSEFNEKSIIQISEFLGINTKFIKLSNLDGIIDSSSTDALVDICKLVGAKEYISGSGGKNYIEAAKFKLAGIELSFQEFNHPTYNQLWGNFIPYMSIIDLLFNEGKKSINYFK